MNSNKNQHPINPIFMIRAYTKMDMARIYSPGREPDSELQNLYRWIRKCAPFELELRQSGYDKRRHSFLKREVEIIHKHFGDP